MTRQWIHAFGLIPFLCLMLLAPGSALGQGGNGNGNGNGNANGNGNKKEKENGSGMGRPAKISWEGCRLTMSDFEETGENGETVLTTSLSFTPDQEIDSADLRVSGSLWGVFDFSPESFQNIAADEEVTVDVTLNKTPCEEGRTIGGTIHLRYGNRTLARPCGVSLKRNGCEENGGEEGEEGEDGEEDQQDTDDGSPPITWQIGGEGEEEELEQLTGDHFDGDGKATATFCSYTALEANIVVTPSLDDCFMLVDPAEADFPLMVNEGDCVDLTFMLTMPAEDFTSACGGTVHVVNAANGGIPRRTFAVPLSVNLFGGEDQEEVVPSAIVSAASFEQQSIAAGQIVSIFGLGLGPEELRVFDLDDDGQIDENLAGSLVLFDGIPAPLLSTYRGQINAIVPTTVAGNDVELLVINGGKQSAQFPVPLGPAAPALFTLDGSGRGQAAAINLDGTVNHPSNAARRGTTVQLFGTGGGPTDLPVADGEIVGENPPRLVSPVSILIGGEEGDLSFAGGAVGLVNGVAQFNVRIPWGISPGPRQVTVIVDGVASADGVTIAVK